MSEIETDRQTDRQADRGGQNRERKKVTDGHNEIETDRQSDRKKGKTVMTQRIFASL